MLKKWSFFAVFCSSLLLVSSQLYSKDIDKEAKKLFEKERYEAVADLLASSVKKGEDIDTKTLIIYGKSLDKLSEKFNTEAEMECYRRPGAPRNQSCMRKFASKLNTKYGAGSFQYVPEIVTIKYTGKHFSEGVEEAGSKRSAAEAAYNRLTKNLIGHPSEVLPRIRRFLNKYPTGKWHKKGLLLWARINEDIWWIHRNWSWLLYDWELSEEDLIVRAEPYRQEAIRTFKRIKGGRLGRIAKKELKMLKTYKSDGKLYGIVNEANIKGVKGSDKPEK